MNNYEILAQGFDNVEITEYDNTLWSPREIVERDPERYNVQEPADPEVKADILEAVEEAKKAAEESASEFYNGPLVRLQNYEVEDSTSKIRLQNTNYFSHVGTRERPELGKENRADPLSVGAILATQDGQLVLGEKSGFNEYGEGEYQLTGAGFVEDPEKQYERSLNSEPASPIHREIEEEVNLNSSKLESIEAEALIGAVHRQPMLVYNAETSLKSEEVAEQWREIPDEEREFSELIFVDQEDVDSLLEGGSEVMATREGNLEEIEYNGELRPHAEGALNL
jgi:hypothetical protein